MTIPTFGKIIWTKHILLCGDIEIMQNIKHLFPLSWAYSFPIIMSNLTSISKIGEENSSFTEDVFIKQIPGWMPDFTKI